jgi:hypothetical protein
LTVGVIAVHWLADIDTQHPAGEHLGPAVAAGITQPAALVGAADTGHED